MYRWNETYRMVKIFMAILLMIMANILYYFFANGLLHSSSLQTLASVCWKCLSDQMLIAQLCFVEN